MKRCCILLVSFMMSVLYGAAGSGQPPQPGRGLLDTKPGELFADLEIRRAEALSEGASGSSSSSSSTSSLSDDRHAKRFTHPTQEHSNSKASRVMKEGVTDFQRLDAQKKPTELTREQKMAIAGVNEKDSDFASILRSIFLGERKIDDEIDAERNRALHEAAHKCYPLAAEELLKMGAHVNEPNLNSYAPLHTAAWFNCPEVAKLLIDFKADLDYQPDEEDDLSTPLGVAAKKGSNAVAALLIDYGADINKISGSDPDGSPLYIAAYHKDIDIAKFLLERGADINIRNRDGETPLYYAVYKNDLDMVTFLVEHGADVNIGDSDGETPLHIATKNNRKDIVELLLKHGANMHIPNKDGETPIHIAAKDILSLFLVDDDI